MIDFGGIGELLSSDNGKKITVTQQRTTAIVVGVLCLWAGSHFGRKRMAQQKPPMLGFLL